MAKRGLHLEKTERGYEVQDEHWNTLGDLVQITRKRKKRWIFKGWALSELTAPLLERIAKLMRGLEDA